MSRPRISLLTALPHSFGEVVDGQGKPHKDYINRQLLAWKSPQEAWNEIGGALETEAENLFQWCIGQRISVFRKANLDTLKAAVAISDIVVVFAHWKGPMFSYKDFITPVSEICNSLDEAAEKSGFKNWNPLIVNTTEDVIETKDQLAKALNARISTFSDWLVFDTDGSDTFFVSEYSAHCFARESIDALLVNGFLPGARIELDDGLWNALQLVACFPKDWSGVCDFSCCKSMHLSSELKIKRRQGLFRADSRFLQPLDIIRYLRCTLELVLAMEYQYSEAAYICNKRQGEIR